MEPNYPTHNVLLVTCGWFIHEEDGRVANHGHGHIELPLVAARVGAALAVGVLQNL